MLLAAIQAAHPRRTPTLSTMTWSVDPEIGNRHIMNSLKGQLLISSPEMANDDFAETVVMLVEHTDEGAYGLVLIE